MKSVILAEKQQEEAHSSDEHDAQAPLLPRAMKLNRDVLLDKADSPIHITSVVEDDQGSFPPAFWCVAAHGGAGCSTLAQLIAPAGDAGHYWPVHDTHRFCVVVSRTTLPSLERAHQVLLQGLREVDDITVLGLVVIKDIPGKIPPVVMNKIEVIKQLTSVWDIDYFPAFRVTQCADLASWSPGDEIDTSRKTRKLPITERVPSRIAVIAQDIFSAARAAFQSISSSTAESNDETEKDCEE